MKIIKQITIVIVLIVCFSCKKSESINDSGNPVNEIQPTNSISIDNSVDSLAIVDYLDCGTINYGGNFYYDENGKIYYQYESSIYTSDGSNVYLTENGELIGTLECEGTIENQENYAGVNSSTNQNIQSQKQWVNCDDCHGTGLKLCYKCSGKGEHFCGSCYGRGSKSSTTGPFTCVDCNGRGVANCRECYGKGNRGDCINCNGRGEVLIEY